MSRATWARLRLAGGVGILLVLVWRLGTGPFLHGVRTVDTTALVLGALIAVPTTVCCAWRWRLVARALDVGVTLPAATGAYYRSQFLNTVLPGGVLGDVHRGLRHGREVADTAGSLRSVGWERGIGQVVQLAVAAVVLLLLPSPARAHVPEVLVALVLVGLVVAVLARRHAGVLGADLRVLLARRTWPALLVVSALALVGHVLTFLVAARAAGAHASTVQLVPLAMVVLLAMGIPANVAGWGPREGVAAWAFAAAGLGAQLGLTIAVVYGVMVLVAGLPGLVVLVVGGAHARRTEPAVAVPLPEVGPWLNAPTPCSAARSRSTATSTPGPTNGCTSPTRTTSRASTRSVPTATPSWSARGPCATTTRACWCARPSSAADRLGRDLPATPTKVTVTKGADLDPDAAFFTTGDADKLVYCASGSIGRARRRLGEVATVVDGGRRVDVRWLSEDLRRRGVRRLMVEGGASVHTQFLTADLADELQLVVAPFFVGNPRANRFVGTGRFPFHPGRRATLAEVRPIGDVVLLRYALSARFSAGRRSWRMPPPATIRPR